MILHPEVPLVDNGRSDCERVPLIAALEQLGVREHLCSLYDGQQETLSGIGPIIRLGLERGESLYIANDDTRHGHE